MNIQTAFQNAFKRKQEKGWDKIYVLVDVHDTIFRGDYGKHLPWQWLGHAKDALQMMSKRNDICLIIWSATNERDLLKILVELYENDICPQYTNHNPEVKDGGQYSFYGTGKIYCNVGIDDKFGFEPDTDWDEIIDFLNKNPE